MASIDSKPFWARWQDQRHNFDRNFGYPGGYTPSSKEVDKANANAWAKSLSGNDDQRQAAATTATGVSEQRNPFQSQVDIEQEAKRKKLQEMGLL